MCENFFFKKNSAFLSQESGFYLKLHPEDANLGKQLATIWQKFFLEPANMGSGEVLQAKMEGASTKNFLLALLLALPVILHCLYQVPNEYGQLYTLVGPKNLVGPKHVDTPPPETKFECAPLAIVSR